ISTSGSCAISHQAVIAPRLSRPPVSDSVASERFEHASGAHPGPDAHRHHAVLLLATTHAVDDGGRAYRAGRTKWMSQCDRAAERVDLGRVQLRIADDR